MLLAAPETSGASLRVRRTLLRGRLSDLESLKSGKDRTKPWVRLLVALERTKRETDFHRELSRLPAKLMTALTRSGRLIFAMRSLLFTDLMTIVTADSDLTNLQKEAP